MLTAFCSGIGGNTIDDEVLRNFLLEGLGPLAMYGMDEPLLIGGLLRMLTEVIGILGWVVSDGRRDRLRELRESAREEEADLIRAIWRFLLLGGWRTIIEEGNDERLLIGGLLEILTSVIAMMG